MLATGFFLMVLISLIGNLFISNNPPKWVKLSVGGGFILGIILATLGFSVWLWRWFP